MMQVPGRQRFTSEGWTLPPDLQAGRQAEQRAVVNLQPIDAHSARPRLVGSKVRGLALAAPPQHGNAVDLHGQLAAQVRLEGNWGRIVHEKSADPGDLEGAWRD